MTSGVSYVLDANVFIEAARRYYAFDIAPRFWQSLTEFVTTGQIVSIDQVARELAKGKDVLANWVDRNFASAIVATDRSDVIQLYGEVITWVAGQAQFQDAAKADFAQGADGWLVAFARTGVHTVVTQEVLALEARRKVPIPNVCNEFNVPCVDTFQMLRTLGIRFN